MAYETDERLKNYLDTNQLKREQLCTAIMAIDKRFTNVRPRHPRGGPDGGRDIEAIFEGTQRVFGAVGFLNQATDGSTHKTKAKRKFQVDVEEALKQSPPPEVFMFFTNVNLSAREKDKLTAIARKGGLKYAEVFDRERLRLVLDNPDGLSIRYQYLGIRLSEAEQATFFARWGDDIQGLIAEGFGTVHKSLTRIQFLLEVDLRLTHLTVIFELKRAYPAAEIGHFRAFAEVRLERTVRGLAAIMIGSTDKWGRMETNSLDDLSKTKTGIGGGTSGAQWLYMVSPDEEDDSEKTPEEIDEENTRPIPYQRVGYSSSAGQDPVRKIPIGFTQYASCTNGPPLTFRDLNEATVSFYVNKSLAEKIGSIVVLANEYRIERLTRDRISFHPPWEFLTIPQPFSDKELADPWIEVCGKDSLSRLRLDFSSSTPKRFYESAEINDL